MCDTPKCAHLRWNHPPGCFCQSTHAEIWSASRGPTADWRNKVSCGSLLKVTICLDSRKTCADAGSPPCDRRNSDWHKPISWRLLSLLHSNQLYFFKQVGSRPNHFPCIIQRKVKQNGSDRELAGNIYHNNAAELACACISACSVWQTRDDIVKPCRVPAQMLARWLVCCSGGFRWSEPSSFIESNCIIRAVLYK